MILGIMGTPGAFKTAYVVQDRIVKFLKDKRPIYTNIKCLALGLMAVTWVWASRC